MGYDSENSHSFAVAHNFPGFQNPSTTSEHGQPQIFRKIGLLFSAPEVLQLHDTMRALPAERVLHLVEHHCRDFASSVPKQLPLVTDRQSQPFATGWVEDTLSHAASDIFQHSGAETDQSGTTGKCYDLMKPDGLATSATWNVCIACDQSYALSAGLGKHQRTVCERTRYWKCQVCPHLIFEKLGELHLHHLSIHADACSNYCNAAEDFLSDHCKVLLSTCTVDVGKRAWGCPCCIVCFDTLRAWNNHKISHWHQLQNEKLSSWSFSTMVRSLLRHRDLVTASNKYDWSLCSWAHMGKNECQTLRFALERHVIPSTMLSHEIYSRISMPDSLVLHTYTLGTAAYNSAAHLKATRCQAASDPVSAHGSMSVNQFSSCQPTNLNFNQHDDIHGGANFGCDENQRPPPRKFAIAADKEADNEELTAVHADSEEYKRAAGIFKTRLRDDLGVWRSEHGPASLASYVPCSKDRSSALLQVGHHRRRVRDQVPIRKGKVRSEATR